MDDGFVGGRDQDNSLDANTLYSHTGFVIPYPSCPILWTSKLHTEISLSTAEAGYIVMSQALREMIPLVNTVVK